MKLIKNIILVAFFLSISISVNAGGTPKKKPIELLRSIDGDTVEVRVNELPKHLSKLKIRILGTDTAESGWRAKCEKERILGENAKKFTKDMVFSAKTIEYELVKWDKFGGRVLGDVILDGKSLRKMLLDQGYARPYFGEKKESWCD